MKNNKWIWIPRILAIIFILFISIFALDVFSEDAPILMQLGGFLIHLIPSFVLIILLVLSWNRLFYGGIAFLLVSMVFTLFFKTYSELINFLVISFPMIVIGSLFIAFDLLCKKRTK